MPATARTRSFRLVVFCFFLSGAAGLMYEVVWLRMLGLLFGESAYAVTSVIAAFMGGLALGSACVSRLAPRVRDPLRTYGWLELGVALTAGLTPIAIALVGAAHGALHRTFAVSHASAAVAEVVMTFLVLLVPTALMGATLPLLIQAIAGDGRPLGRPVSVLYAINTFGAV